MRINFSKPGSNPWIRQGLFGLLFSSVLVACGGGDATETIDVDRRPSVLASITTRAKSLATGTRTASLTTQTLPQVLVVDALNGPYTTLAAALAVATAGQTITARAGVYHENIEFPQSGTPGAYITLQADPGAIIDGTGMDGSTPLVTISGQSYVRIQGFELRNLKPTSIYVDATAILVSGAATGVQVLNNTIHDIWASPAASAVNAHGIHIAGNTHPGLTQVTVSGNQIYNMKTGWSENLTVNGNVDGFEVSNNTIHDTDNIGIDIAGFYGMAPALYDNARNGWVVGNHVYNVTSLHNPAYAGVRAADGIYVDGGKSITIERNRVENTDIGIEIASEKKGKSTSDIVVRNNVVSRSYQGNIMVGGYARNKGNAVNITLVNNSTYGAQAGEIVIQNNGTNVIVKNNILVALPSSNYLSQTGRNNTQITIANNLYYGASTTSAGAWTDLQAKFTNPQWIATPGDMHLSSTSPAVNAGVLADYGTLDFDGHPRLNGATDLGAHELQ
jgi:Right handed beta helix region